MGRVLERQEGLLAQPVTLTHEFLTREGDGAKHGFPFEGFCHNGVLAAEIAGVVRGRRPEYDVALRRNNGQKIEMKTALNDLEPLTDVRGIPHPVHGGVHDGLLEGDEVKDGLNVVQSCVVRGPRSAQIEAYLLLRLADDAVFDDAQADECGQKSENNDQRREGLKKFRFQHDTSAQSNNLRSRQPGHSHEIVRRLCTQREIARILGEPGRFVKEARGRKAPEKRPFSQEINPSERVSRRVDLFESSDAIR